MRLITPTLAESLWRDTTKPPMAREPWHPLCRPSLGPRACAWGHIQRDCLYLAPALSFRDDVLVTADERFVRPVQTDRALHHSIISLADA